MLDHLLPNAGEIVGTVFSVRWMKDGAHLFAQVGAIAAVYSNEVTLPSSVNDFEVEEECREKNTEGYYLWKPGCLIASFDVFGGVHNCCSKSNINKNPDDFWASESDKGFNGVEIVFRHDVKIRAITIGARKDKDLWNEVRYYNVKVYIDNELKAITGTDRIPDDYKINIMVPETVGRKIKLQWFDNHGQIATIEVAYKDTNTKRTKNWISGASALGKINMIGSTYYNNPITNIDSNVNRAWHSNWAYTWRPQGVEVVFPEKYQFFSIILHARRESCYDCHTKRYSNVELLIDEKIISKTVNNFIVPENFMIDFMSSSGKEECNECESGIVGSSVKFLWKTSYAMISRIDIEYKELTSDELALFENIIEEEPETIESQYGCLSNTFMIWKGINNDASGTPEGALQGQRVKSAVECAEICRDFGDGCKSFTWRPDRENTCWLKKDWTKTRERKEDELSWSGIRCDLQKATLTPSRKPNGISTSDIKSCKSPHQLTYWKGISAIGPVWPAGPKQAQVTNSVEACAKKCMEFGEDCVVFTWDSDDKLCIFKSDWVDTAPVSKSQNTWSGHRCDYASVILPQFPRHGIYPSGSILPKPVPPARVTRIFLKKFGSNIQYSELK